jgi:hypothetical protein
MTATIDPRQLRLPCQHRWIVPTFPTSEAGAYVSRCANCGAVRTFTPFEERQKTRKFSIPPREWR